MKQKKANLKKIGRGRGAASKVAASIAAAFMALQLYACKKPSASETETKASPTGNLSLETMLEAPALAAAEVGAKSGAYTGAVAFSAEGIAVKGEGVETSGSAIKITKGGTYLLAGAATAAIGVAAKQEKVYLVFSGLNLTCAEESPLRVSRAAGVAISLLPGTTNSLTYVPPVGSARPGSAIMLSAPAVFTGGGSLFVNAVEGDGIIACDAAQINGATVSVSAGREGIAAKELRLSGANVTVEANGRGLLSFGDLMIDGGLAVINAEKEALSVSGNLDVSAGTVLLNGFAKNSAPTIVCNQTFTVSGGLLLSAGADADSTVPVSSAAQYSVRVDFETLLEPDTLVYVTGEGGEVLAAFRPKTAFRNLTLSTPEFIKGCAYSVYVGGAAAGLEKDGLCDSASGGTLFSQFTVA